MDRGRKKREREEEGFILCANLINSMMAATAFVIEEEEAKKSNREGTKTTKRQRTNIVTHLNSLAPGTFRKMYRMHQQTFFGLYYLIETGLDTKPSKPKKGTPVNGAILKETRLMMALRFFAGGDKFDIAAMFGVHENEVYRSVWRVVDAIHNCLALDIQYPSDHNQQLAMANEFKDRISKADFDNCAGAIDCMLVWIHRPSEMDLGCGTSKFMCGRKKKFGINLQAVCDAKRRFADVCAGHPGSASDFGVFKECELRSVLERDGFLAPGLCLYGDCAYVNTNYMVTPFKGVSGGTKDDYNFCHSQVRITIECAFGMLVHRWGCLRKAMPVNFTVQKINSLVLALCKLHNYCIDSFDSL